MQASYPRVPTGVVGFTALLTPACGDSSAPLVGEVPFDSAFEVVAQIELEQSEDALVVEATIRADPQGGLILADRSEQQVRKYSDDGELEWRFGRSGPGPEEFSSPNVAIRLADHEILAVDAHAKALVWNEERGEVDRLLSYDLASVDDADKLDDGRVLYSGRAAVGGSVQQSRTLHILDPSSGQVVQSFFNPPLTEITGRFSSMAGWTASDVLGDRIAAVFALADTVYVFDIHGREERKIAFPTQSFVRMDDSPAAGINPGRYLMSHSFAATVDWLEGDRLLVAYQDFQEGSPVWHLLSFSTDGSNSWEIRDAPRLYHVADDGRFYFDDPHTLEPNRIMVARLRER